jgi:2'-5' RNA ligase
MSAVESIELHFEAEGLAAVRAVWSALADAQLPSLATGPHAPHVTLSVIAAGSEVATTTDAAIGEVATPLVGTTLRLPGVGVFPRKRSVLYGSVVPTAQLVAVQHRVHEVLEAAQHEPFETAHPDAWTPHVTLAKRIDADELARATALCTKLDWPLDLTVGSVIRWNGLTRTTTQLA